MTESILDRAAQAFPTVIGFLDAVHLAGVLAVADPAEKGAFVVLTYDIQLTRATLTAGYDVAGV